MQPTPALGVPSYPQNGCDNRAGHGSNGLGHNVEIETHLHANHRKFPFDKVKIKSFIDALDRTEASAVISSIVELAKSLNLAIIAEGIETDDQRKRIRSLGIKFGQGFLFAEPVPLNRLTAWARSVSRKDGPLAPKPSMTR
jgi:predicted signal transduction protein with EAL and GGDEF domain